MYLEKDKVYFFHTNGDSRKFIKFQDLLYRIGCFCWVDSSGYGYLVNCHETDSFLPFTLIQFQGGRWTLYETSIVPSNAIPVQIGHDFYRHETLYVAIADGVFTELLGAKEDDSVQEEGSPIQEERELTYKEREILFYKMTIPEWLKRGEG
jgi:hypothetical protein